MSRATGRREALEDMAALLGSGKPPTEIMDGVLDAVMRAVGATCLSLVTTGVEPGHIRSWTANLDGQSPLNARCVELGALACLQPANLQLPEDLSLFHIPCSDGKLAALVSDGVHDHEWLSLITGCLALLLHNEELSVQLASATTYSDKRIAEVAAVYEIGQAINDVDIHRLLPIITEKAAAVMDAQACSLLLMNPESNCLTIEASWGLASDIVKGTRIAMGEGIAGRVASTGEAMLLVDVGADPRFASGTVKPRREISSSICAPLKDESGRCLGVLTIRRHVPARLFTDEDLKLFCVFASQAALAISNAQLYSSLTQRIAEISTVSDLLQKLNSTLDLDDVLNQIADNIIEVVGFDRCCVYLLDPRSNRFVADIRRGYNEGELPQRVRLGQGTIGIAARECIPMFDRLGEVSEPSFASSPRFLAAPAVVRDECIGVVVVDNALSGRPIKPSDVELLSTFVNQAGIAIENARLYEAMEEKYTELNVLFEHSKTISSAYGLENVAHISTAVARKAVPCDGCLLLLLNDKRSTIALHASAGIPQDVLDKVNQILSDDQTVEFIRDLRSPLIMSCEMAADYSKQLADVSSRMFGPEGSSLFIPLLTEDATVGVFVLTRRDKVQFATGEMKLLAIVASQAAVVLKNALRYEQRMTRQVMDLSTLYEFSRRISASGSLEEALDAILGIVADLVDCDQATIYAIDHDINTLVATAARPAAKLPNQPLASNSVMSWAVRERKAIVSPDISADSRFDPVSLDDRPVRSLMSIPLMVQDDAVGVLCVSSFSPNMYSEDDVRVLSIIASQSAAIYKELEALAALTTYTDNILSSIAAGVVTLDSEGTILTWNRAAEVITSWKANEIVGLNYREVIGGFNIADVDKNATVQIIDKVRQTGKVYQGYKLCYHPNDRGKMFLNLSASVLWNNSGDPIGQVIIFEDITKEIRMEDEFRRMGELAAVGQLAASIAHELRNPLSSIKGAAQYLSKEYENESLLVEFLGIIVEEVDGLSKLTTEFLEFARPMEFEIGPIDVNEIVRKTLQLMSVHIAESNVNVIDHLALKLPNIQADGKQLEQVLRNIILNAVQAMSEGGTLSIQTKHAPSGVELILTDTGIGIPEDKLDRIFIPFFTTKTKGTGLGLAVVQKIVENHGGHMDVSSVMGQGTTFRISLPEAGIVRVAPQEADTTERRQ